MLQATTILKITVNEHFQTLPYRYIYAPAVPNAHNPQTFTTLMKYDLHTGEQKKYAPGAPFELGEAVFASCQHAVHEDDGYVLFFAWDGENKKSSFKVLDARSMTLISEILLPVRIPHGLHGSWFADT